MFIKVLFHWGVNICVYSYICIWYTHMCVCICVYICMCVYMYTYINVCMHWIMMWHWWKKFESSSYGVRNTMGTSLLSRPNPVSDWFYLVGLRATKGSSDGNKVTAPFLGGWGCRRRHRQTPAFPQKDTAYRLEWGHSPECPATCGYASPSWQPPSWHFHIDHTAPLTRDWARGSAPFAPLESALDQICSLDPSIPAPWCLSLNTV